MATVPLAGCLLGFLRYNFNPASVFLGDCGSLTIGFLLGCFGVIWSQKSATLLGLLAPAMAFALPLFDVLLSVGRRFLRDKPIFSPDAGHIHHRLLGKGIHPRMVAFILYAICAVAAVFSLLQSSFGYHVGGISVILFCVLAIFGIKHLGYIEFATAKRVLSGNILGLVRQEVYLAHFREDLLRANTHIKFWLIVREACKQMAFTSVQLTLGSEVFEETLAESSGPGWQLSISFGEKGSLMIEQSLTESSQTVMTSFSRVLHECIHSKTFVGTGALSEQAAHALV